MMNKPVLFGILSLTLMASAVRAAEGDLAEKTVANWTKECQSCHGKDGKGRTKAGRKAGVKDFTDLEYQKKLTDEQMFKQIKMGMKDEDGKEKMKAYGDKLKDEEIKALVAYVRKFAKKEE